jgi:hypothetical protein
MTTSLLVTSAGIDALALESSRFGDLESMPSSPFTMRGRERLVLGEGGEEGGRREEGGAKDEGRISYLDARFLTMIADSANLKSEIGIQTCLQGKD